MEKRNTLYNIGNNNFFIGMASAFCLFGNFFPLSPYFFSEQYDNLSLYNDWAVVGNDIAEALNNGK
ncbi:MAG: hypothetical protein ACI352_03195 [Elusimicrobiaceae bacterium]